MDLSKVSKIKKLAKNFGTPLVSTEFIGNGVTFTYKIGGRDFPYKYSNAERGIQEELIRIQRLIEVERRL